MNADAKRPRVAGGSDRPSAPRACANARATCWSPRASQKRGAGEAKRGGRVPAPLGAAAGRAAPAFFFDATAACTRYLLGPAAHEDAHCGGGKRRGERREANTKTGPPKRQWGWVKRRARDACAVRAGACVWLQHTHGEPERRGGKRGRTPKKKQREKCEKVKTEFFFLSVPNRGLALKEKENQSSKSSGAGASQLAARARHKQERTRDRGKGGWRSREKQTKRNNGSPFFNHPHIFKPPPWPRSSSPPPSTRPARARRRRRCQR